jgi:hypothetical protein
MENLVPKPANNRTAANQELSEDESSKNIETLACAFDLLRSWKKTGIAAKGNETTTWNWQKQFGGRSPAYFCNVDQEIPLATESVRRSPFVGR